MDITCSLKDITQSLKQKFKSRKKYVLYLFVYVRNAVHFGMDVSLDFVTPVAQYMISEWPKLTNHINQISFFFIGIKCTVNTYVAHFATFTVTRGSMNSLLSKSQHCQIQSKQWLQMKQSCSFFCLMESQKCVLPFYMQYADSILTEKYFKYDI